MAGLGVALIIGALLSLIFFSSEPVPPDTDKDEPVDITISVTKEDALDVYEIIQLCKATKSYPLELHAQCLEDAFRSTIFTLADLSILEEIRKLADNALYIELSDKTSSLKERLILNNLLHTDINE